MTADTDMMTIVDIAVVVGSIMLLAIFWWLLPKLLKTSGPVRYSVSAAPW